jgi:hypothetical protein
MTAAKIRELMNAEPFRPFQFHLPSGGVVAVPHHDFVAISPTGRIVIVLGENDSETVLDVALIERIEKEAAH